MSLLSHQYTANAYLQQWKIEAVFSCSHSFSDMLAILLKVCIKRNEMRR